jgi:Kef-type K+ transport system membrane component KefB
MSVTAFPVLARILKERNLMGNNLATTSLACAAIDDISAFMAGLVMPKDKRLLTEVVERIESLSLALLLPLFFALTGLRTRIDLLSGKSALGYGVAILAIAVLAKLAGATFAAKIIGAKWKDSIALGVLMNTRGLVELVILNTALDLGVSSPELFIMMVPMAIIPPL